MVHWNYNKNKCKYKIDYIANGEAFLTKPGRTIFMAKKIIKKAGLVVGTVAPNGEVAHKLVNEGTLFVIGSLSGLLAKSAKEFLEQAKIK